MDQEHPSCGRHSIPGVTAAPAIGEDIALWAAEMLKADPRKHSSIRKGVVKTRFLIDEERDALIKKNPAYGHIVCRCEEISEGEIIDAIHSIIPPTTIDGIKRRVRAGMGRCQGGFCQPMVVRFLAKEETAIFCRSPEKRRRQSLLLLPRRANNMATYDVIVIGGGPPDSPPRKPR
jgi:bacterioferritin-associated ferredoxin